MADSDKVAACAPKTGPWSRTRRNRIGPATKGNPASQPAMAGPHHLPDTETTRRKNGTSVSFSGSMANRGDLKSDRTRICSSHSGLDGGFGGVVGGVEAGLVLSGLVVGGQCRVAAAQVSGRFKLADFFITIS